MCKKGHWHVETFKHKVLLGVKVGGKIGNAVLSLASLYFGILGSEGGLSQEKRMYLGPQNPARQDFYVQKN